MTMSRPLNPVELGHSNFQGRTRGFGPAAQRKPHEGPLFFAFPLVVDAVRSSLDFSLSQ